MRRYWFAFGILATILVLLVGGYFWLRLGFVNPRADQAVNQAEAHLMGAAMDAAVARRAPSLLDPAPPTPANLAAGAQLYQTHCALCHGDQEHPQAPLAQALYPRAPQFYGGDPADMPDNQNFYIVQHGIRNTGMPAWEAVLSPAQLRQVVTFLHHMK